ncbi:unnamed protein product [Ilex paraguariensis]|uniref:Uncharacterized protein n=1 Tax=Ilex paraguariensis TaxID=185542 RepID=A0ABC8RSZ3_9AQUA
MPPYNLLVNQENLIPQSLSLNILSVSQNPSTSYIPSVSHDPSTSNIPLISNNPLTSQIFSTTHIPSNSHILLTSHDPSNTRVSAIGHVLLTEQNSIQENMQTCNSLVSNPKSVKLSSIPKSDLAKS